MTLPENSVSKNSLVSPAEADIFHKYNQSPLCVDSVCVNFSTPPDLLVTTTSVLILFSWSFVE